MNTAVRVLAVVGSPSATSGTARTVALLADRLTNEYGFEVHTLAVRDLPAGALLHADLGHPAIVAAADAVRQADGVIVATPIYQAAYTGLLKAFLDLLPKGALTGKVVLPIATAGTMAHLLAIDYTLRPVLSTLGADHIAAGYLLLNELITRGPEGQTIVEPKARAALEAATDTFAVTLRLVTRSSALSGTP